MMFAKAHPHQTHSESNHTPRVKLRIINGGQRTNDMRGEMRCSRRVPIECYVKVNVPGNGEVFYAMSKDLSVDGLALVGHYVPRHGEVMEILMQSPRGSTTKPFKAQVRVKRCVQLGGNSGYEIGVSIIKVRE